MKRMSRAMRVNEIFYSLQGEGRNTGQAAVFIRFAGCNLRCPFCDTDYSRSYPLSEEEIATEAARYPAQLVVVTGGEPALQLTASLIDKLHALGKRVAVETNGTRQLPDNVDWVTVSPKQVFLGEEAKLLVNEADEVKVVFDGCHDPEAAAAGIKATHYYLQPCDVGDAEQNREITRQCVEYILSHPKWTLSLQTHKLLNIK